ncbi:MAG: metallophosphoesterase [Cyanobacteriota bacterium]|jgi:serine/threonine protein phosphatase 1|nr:metallophosphoesterase [Cyanobacteriota bacterium]
MPFPTQPTRHWVIGDVHGCVDPLRRLAEQLPRRDRLVLCGDVVNRGPHIAEAMEFAWELVGSGRGVWLMGNHEAALLAALQQETPSGGLTLAGNATFRQLGERRCRSWIERLAQLPEVYWGEGWVATHAGFDPVTWKPQLNIRLPFWQSYDGRYGEVVVGHTPGPHVRRIGRIVLVDTGACYGGQLSAYCPETGEVHQTAGLNPWNGTGFPSLSARAAMLERCVR